MMHFTHFMSSRVPMNAHLLTNITHNVHSMCETVRFLSYEDYLENDDQMFDLGKNINSVNVVRIP